MGALSGLKSGLDIIAESNKRMSVEMDIPFPLGQSIGDWEIASNILQYVSFRINVGKLQVSCLAPLLSLPL